MERLPPVLGPAPPPQAEAERIHREPQNEAGGSFREILDGLGRELDQGRKMTERALKARGQLDATQLLTLQAGVYRYSEVVELSTKLIDRASNALRTTLQSQ